jgi:hypothetical protein
LLAVLSAPGLAARGGGTTTVAATGRTAPLLAPVTGEATGGAVDGIGAGGEQAAFHIHAHLALFVTGGDAPSRTGSASYHHCISL